ncbi:MAG: rod-binding protein [Methyloligellaceae bacterium]
MDAALAYSPANLSAQSKAIIGQRTGTDGSALRANARKAAEEFESVFLTSMLEGMFSGLKTDAPYGGGHSEKVYRSLLVGEYAKEISRSGGIGIADHVYREILAAQEGASK